MVEGAKLNDEMYEQHGIDEDEFANAVIFYKIHEDPEILRIQ